MNIEDIKNVLNQLEGEANPKTIEGVKHALSKLTNRLEAYNYVITKLDDELALVYMERAIEEAETDAWSNVLSVLKCEDLTLTDDFIVISIEDNNKLDLDNLDDIDVPF